MHFIPAPKSIELHLSGSPLFTKYSKKVKALGGRYSECRGHSHTRYVHLPFTSDGRALANRLVAEFSARPATTIIARGVDTFRGWHVPAPVVVQRVSRSAADPCSDFLAAYESAFLRAFPDAAEPEPEPEPVDEGSLLVSITITRDQAGVVLAALNQRVVSLELEGPDCGDAARLARDAYQSIDRQVWPQGVKKPVS